MSKLSNEISATPRTDFGKGASRRARRDGKIPVVIYSKGNESRGCLVEAKDWEALSRHSISLLTLKEGNKKCTVIPKDVQFNTLKGAFVHIDFAEVHMDEEITTMVQIEHGGEDAIGLSQGGVLEQPTHEIEVKCLPGKLPETFELDISAIGLEEALLAKDIVLPEGVVLESDPELIIFRVNKPASEVSADATDEGEGEGEGDGEGEAQETAEASKE